MVWFGICEPHMLTFAQTFDRLFSWASWTSYRNPPWGGGLLVLSHSWPGKPKLAQGGDWWVNGLERTGPTIAHRNTRPLCSAPNCSLIRNSHRIKWEGGGSINCTQTNNSCGCVRNNWALKYPQNVKRPNNGCLHGISSVQESKSSSILKAVLVIYLFLESFWLFEPSVHEFVPCCKHCI